MRGYGSSFVHTVSPPMRSMVSCSHKHRLGRDQLWPRSDYPLRRAITDWCCVRLSSEGQPTWKLLGEWRPVGLRPSIILPRRAPHPPAALANPPPPLLRLKGDRLRDTDGGDADGEGRGALHVIISLSLLCSGFLGAARGGWRGPGARRARKRVQYPRPGVGREP